jgi:alkylation response protein AidB-like acyl-CoA dehydrogenase
MDFRFTQDEEDFRQEVRGFIRDELPADWDGAGAYGTADEDAAASVWELSRRISKKLAERKWLAMPWPVEYGGLAASHMRQLIYNEEMAYRGVPGAWSMGVAWVGPAVMLYGTDEQKQTYLPRIASGEDIWCTLYSEPGAGSDLAALQTSAVEDGDDFVINGQKIWTSYAHRSTWGWLAARTDPAAPKHKGISTFVVKMDSPGINVRPLVNMAGQADFNEVFFDEVRVPKANLVGELNRGWYHVAVALDFERSGIQAYAGARRTLERLVETAREQPETLRHHPLVRYQLAERAIELAAGTKLAYRIPWMQSQGVIPNHEASIAKLYGSELGQRLAQTGLQVLGLFGQLESGSQHAALKGQLARNYLTQVAATIGAGTSEVQRGIVATRGLGLPRG